MWAKAPTEGEVAEMLDVNRRAGIAALAIALVTAVVAAPTHAANKAAAPTTVKLGVIPIAAMAPIQLGITKGFYGRQGINLSINKNLALPSYLPSVASGAVDGVTLNYGQLASGASAGLPLVAINTLNVGGLTPERDDPQLVTRSDSGITKVADLRGKTIAVSALGSTQEVTVRRAAQRAGIGATSVKLVAVPFAQMGAVMRSKQVDAALIGEPFTTQLKQQLQIRVLAGGTLVWRKGQQNAVLIMSRKWWNENRAVGLKLQHATRQAVDYAARHPREVRAILPSFTGLPAAVTSRQVLPRYVSTIDVKDAQNTARIMKAYGVLKTVPDMSKFVIKPKPAPTTKR